MALSTDYMYKVTAVVTGVAGSPYYLTQYFSILGGTAGQAAEDWMRFVANIGDSLHTGVTARLDTDVEVIDPTNGNVVTIESVSPQSTAGSNAYAYAPLGTQWRFEWRTAEIAGNRRLRGRHFRPLVAATDVDATTGDAKASAVTDMNALALTLINRVNSIPVVWSKKYQGWAPITSFSVPARFSSLRTRRS